MNSISDLIELYEFLNEFTDKLTNECYKAYHFNANESYDSNESMHKLTKLLMSYKALCNVAYQSHKH